MSNSTQQADFLKTAEALAKANGISEQQAEGYMSVIGENPETDEQGRVIVRDKNGNEVARLVFPSAVS
jgi:hypothetical protein